MNSTGWVGVGHLLTPDQTAAQLGVSTWTVAKLRRAGGLSAIRIGNAWRYDPADIRKYIENNRSEAT